ncbi:MAG: cell division protein FtsL [Pseudomonadota bacterium]
MSRTQIGLLGLLGLAVIVSGIGVVYAKYLSRKHFVSLQELQSERERIAVEWGRLQLEESTLATHSKVESTARGRLGMHLPHIDEVMVIRR